MSGIRDYKITDTTGYKVADVPGETLSGTVAQNKAVFDKLAELVITNYNDALDYLYSKGIDTGGSGSALSAYPVGSLYISTNNTNPTTIIGGTWVQIKDRFLLAAGDTYSGGATGGSADAIVPNHDHRVSSKTVSGSIHTSIVTAGSGSSSVQSINSSGVNTQSFTGTLSDFYTDSTGVIATGKNMPPYLVVYVWQRTE